MHGNHSSPKKSLPKISHRILELHSSSKIVQSKHFRDASTGVTDPAACVGTPLMAESPPFNAAGPIWKALTRQIHLSFWTETLWLTPASCSLLSSLV